MRVIRTLWRLSREAIRYRTLYTIAILSTLALTGVNLAAPKVLSAMTGIVESGVDDAGMRQLCPDEQHPEQRDETEIRQNEKASPDEARRSF